MVLWNYPYLIFLRHCFTQKILIFISRPYKAVLGIYTRKNKLKFKCKGLLTSLTTVKIEIWEKQENWRWRFFFFLKKPRDRTIGLQANVHALVGNIYSICYISTYSTWVVFVVSKLLLICVTFVRLFILKKYFAIN